MIVPILTREFKVVWRCGTPIKIIFCEEYERNEGKYDGE
jgi:hypothetical protein